VSSARRLRIGIEATSLLGARTGIGAMTRALLVRLGAVSDIDVTGIVISWRGRGQVETELPPGVANRSLLFPAQAAHRLWRRFNQPSLGGFDVIHGPNYVVPPGRGTPELVSVHDFGPWHYPDYVTSHARVYPELVQRALARGAHVHVDSAFVGAEAEEILGIDPERIHVIRLGFDSQDRGDPARAQARIGSRYVLSLGTIEPRKDLPTLVAAMAMVRHKAPDLRLVVAGPDGWGTESFATAVEFHQMEDRVVRLGYVSEAERADLLAGAACLAFPSIYEGFGLPPLEAMAASTPVITTTAGSLPEICGPAARYFPARSHDYLAEAIVEVTSDDVVASALVTAGHEQIRRYSWDRTAAEMLDLYRRLAAA